MPYPTTLPLIGGLSILAVAGGVSLGNATISQINPIYFQAPEGRFYSDLVPNRPSGKAPVEMADDYVQPDYAYSATPYCQGCTTGLVDYRPEPIEAVARPRMRRSEVAYVETVVVEDQPVEPPAPNRQWIDRYTDYSVAADPAEIADAPPPPAEGGA
jgi:hypothetical protein